MKRKIIKIDESKCNGCGDCIPACPEGAIQIIDGKARLVSDLFCDGLGACLGTCPTGAISVEEREAEQYDEEKVMERIMEKGENTIRAHLKHLKDHGEQKLYDIAVETLKKHNQSVPELTEKDETAEEGLPSLGCPGAMAQKIKRSENSDSGTDAADTGDVPSRLQHWPVKLRLLNPDAPYLEGSDLTVAADCTAFAFGNFHSRYIRNKVVVTFCPKLDKDISEYVEKLAAVFTRRNIKFVTIVRMEVPCCGGTQKIVEAAMQKADVRLPVQCDIISVDGELKQSESLSEQKVESAVS